MELKELKKLAEQENIKVEIRTFRKPSKEKYEVVVLTRLQGTTPIPAFPSMFDSLETLDLYKKSLSENCLKIFSLKTVTHKGKELVIFK